MPRLSEKLWLLCVLVAVAAGCKPKVGDDCRISRDCSAAGDRLCDITAPGGYCTVYNCEPDTCPEDESLCVEFGAQRSPVSKCEDKQSPSPYGRAFCMATCEEDSDCRSGYSCEDLSNPKNPWGAVLIDLGRGKRACVVPMSENSVVTEEGKGGAFGDVCRSELPPEQSTGGSGSGDVGAGAAPSGGAPDASSSGGAGAGGAGG
ncbi:MAG TPA: hypothetical protein VHP33_09430 [Polyangiaceae bacterium]|nr:hypothetical protein [Polyangiaceae bacterium]